MIKEKLLEIWKRRLNNNQIIAKAQELGEELPPSFYNIQELKQTRPNFDKLKPSKSGDRMQSFRPSPEVLLILLELKNKSRFINDAIKFYWDGYFKEIEGGKNGGY